MKRTFFFFFIFVASTPSSAQWRNANFNGQVLAFGVHDTSLFISINAGTPDVLLWRLVSLTPDVVWQISDMGISRSQGNVTSFASLGTYLFASQGSNRLMVSSNNGSTWGLGNARGPVASNGKYLFGGLGSSLARSVDTDKTWTRCIPPNPNNIYAAGACIFVNNDTAIWCSTDTGNDWMQVHPPFLGTVIPMDSLVFLVSGIGKVAKSTDSGTSWSIVTVDSGGIPQFVNCLATDGKNLFVGTSTGILVSTDTGKDWTAKNDSITYQDIYHDNLKATEDVVAIGVFDTLVFADVLYNRSPNGVSSYYLFDRSISELTDTTPSGVVEATPPGDTIEIYPNPATGTVAIFSGSTAIFGVSVLNVLGVVVLDAPNVNGPSRTLDLSKEPAGTYFVQLQTMKGTVLRKIILNK